MPQDGLLAQNLAALREFLPHLESLLPAYDATVSTVVFDDDGTPIDINLGKDCLYREPARAYAEKQVASYLEKPVRVLSNQPAGTGLESPLSIAFAEWMLSDLNDNAVPVRKKPVTRVGYAVILGIGLGLHLEELISRLDATHIVLIEPYAEFLRHSLSVTDWRPIAEHCQEAGKKLYVFVENKPDPLLFVLSNLIDAKGAIFLDGSYVFTHYPSWQFNEFHDRFSKSLNHYFVAKGYFEDEIKMINNTAGNFLRFESRLIERKHRVLRKEPAFLVGSGPSVEADIEVIKALRDRVVLFSCGTGMQVLLSRGIIPDFHCEMENGPEVPQVLKHVRSKYSFDGITLVASTTVNPEAVELFDEKWLFFRDTVSSEHVFARELGSIRGIAPTVANTAFVIANLWGFREIYLFGVDCGSRDPGQHHSPASIYETMPEFTATLPPFDFDITLDGNFGGKATTNWLYDMVRRMIEAYQAVYQAKLFNCSNGALIRGATPKASRSIRFSHGPLDHAAIKDAIRRTERPFAPAEFFRQYPLPDMTAVFDDLRAEIAAMMAAARDEDDGMEAFYPRTESFFESLPGRHAGVWSTFIGSARAFPRIAYFFLVRIPDDDARRAAFARFLGEYERVMLEMVDHARDLIVGAQRQIDAALAAG